MKSTHLKEIGSTQEELKEMLRMEPSIGQNVLLSTSKQTKGLGRRGQNWVDFPNNLAFSFSLKLEKDLHFLPLEMGILINRFFEEKFQTSLSLKWPNDLMSRDKKKVGGILCQTFQNNILVGIGLNLFPSKEDEIMAKKVSFPFAAVLSQKVSIPDFQKVLPKKIAQYILDYRLEKSQTTHEWTKLCCHLKEEVKITDEGNEVSGIFEGLNHDGAAQLNVSGVLQDIYTGSLFLKSV